MLRKLSTLSKSYYVNWTPDEVYEVLVTFSIPAETLIQCDRYKTKKLIREFYLLACRASLNSIKNRDEKTMLLTNYAKQLKEISNDYDVIFGRKIMSEVNPLTEEQNSDEDVSVINNIDRMQARLYYLITQFTVHPCKHIAGKIVELLTMLCKHPNIELLPAQHYIYSQSLNYWRSRLVHCPKADKKPLIH